MGMAKTRAPWTQAQRDDKAFLGGPHMSVDSVYRKMSSGLKIVLLHKPLLPRLVISISLIQLYIIINPISFAYLYVITLLPCKVVYNNLPPVQ